MKFTVFICYVSVNFSLIIFTLFTSDKGGCICFRPRLFVCLSVCKITQNACMDLYEMLRVDKCRDMDELVNF